MQRTKTTQRTVTIDQVVGANIRKLRRGGGSIISQEKLCDDLRDFDVEWGGPKGSPDVLIRIEKGTRSVKAHELWALSKYFNVPVWFFFVPSADLLDTKIRSGTDQTDAAQMLIDLIDPPSEPNWVPQFLAAELAREVIAETGNADAVRRLLELTYMRK